MVLSGVITVYHSIAFPARVIDVLDDAVDHGAEMPRHLTYDDAVRQFLLTQVHPIGRSKLAGGSPLKTELLEVGFVDVFECSVKDRVPFQSLCPFCPAGFPEGLGPGH